jgi:hypothetical protein
MTTIVWGETHCPWCEKRIPGTDEMREAERIEKFCGINSKESERYDAQFCWASFDGDMCEPYIGSPEDVEARLIAVLNERDELRAKLAAA